jgi:hypothetical protein
MKRAIDLENREEKFVPAFTFTEINDIIKKRNMNNIDLTSRNNLNKISKLS